MAVYRRQTAWNTTATVKLYTFIRRKLLNVDTNIKDDVLQKEPDYSRLIVKTLEIPPYLVTQDSDHLTSNLKLL